MFEDFDVDTNVLLICYGTDNSDIISALSKSKASLHIDIGQSLRMNDLENCLLGRVKTIFLSTSSELFLRDYDGSIEDTRKQLLELSDTLVFKENRGGIRLFTEEMYKPIQVGAQVRPIIHSVGVGDCFDAAFIALQCHYSQLEALSYASWISSEYACYGKWNHYKENVSQVKRIPPDEIVEMEGIKLAWEHRNDFNIYIAAPDFDYVDRTHIDKVASSLAYHNFRPRLPIREFGQVKFSDIPAERKRIFRADMELLEECDMLIAVLAEQDDGTMIEIGLAAARKLPVIVYDPNGIAQNLVLQNLPDLISSDLDKILVKVFEIASRGAND
jgi:nucleoside 2-deoxyribosyltransferase